MRAENLLEGRSCRLACLWGRPKGRKQLSESEVTSRPLSRRGRPFAPRGHRGGPADLPWPRGPGAARPPAGVPSLCQEDPLRPWAWAGGTVRGPFILSAPCVSGARWPPGPRAVLVLSSACSSSRAQGGGARPVASLSWGPAGPGEPRPRGARAGRRWRARRPLRGRVKGAVALTPDDAGVAPRRLARRATLPCFETLQPPSRHRSLVENLDRGRPRLAPLYDFRS